MWRKKTEVVESPANNSSQYTANSTGVIVARLVWAVASIVIAVLAIRFFFILFGANQGNGFVNFIYSVSYPFAKPFFGVFGYHLHYGVSRIEMASIVAIAIYALAAYLLGRLLTISRSHSSV